MGWFYNLIKFVSQARPVGLEAGGEEGGEGENRPCLPCHGQGIRSD